MLKANHKRIISSLTPSLRQIVPIQNDRLTDEMKRILLEVASSPCDRPFPLTRNAFRLSQSPEGVTVLEDDLVRFDARTLRRSNKGSLIFPCSSEAAV